MPKSETGSIVTLEMATYRKKYNKRKSGLRSNRTGEDIDMLNERKMEESPSYASGSTRYKNHIDGA